MALPGELPVAAASSTFSRPDWEHPLRIELWDDEIASLRQFEVATQRSLATQTEAAVTALQADAADRHHLADYLPPNAWFVLLEPAEMREEARRYLSRLERGDEAHSLETVLARAFRFPSCTIERIAGTLEAFFHLPVESVERFSGDIGKVRSELETSALGQQVFVVCPTEAEAQRLSEIFADSSLKSEGRLHFPVGRLQAGFRLPTARRWCSAAAICSIDTICIEAPVAAQRVIDTFWSSHEGDLVVHGPICVARFLGLRLIEKGETVEEHLSWSSRPASRCTCRRRRSIGAEVRRGEQARPAGPHRRQDLGATEAAAQQAVLDLASEFWVCAAAGFAAGNCLSRRFEWQRNSRRPFLIPKRPINRGPSRR